MDSRIGSVLRETRKRRGLEIAEIEAATRIRARFLRAIENEEWDVLPGGVYTRGFIRTYAAFVGLDGERLADDFRREVEGASSRRPPAREMAPIAAGAATGSPGGRRTFAYLRWLAVPAVILVAVVAIVAIPAGGGEDGRSPSRSGAQEPPPAGAQPDKPPVPAPDTVSIRLQTEAEVWVCLVDAGDRHLVDGQILAAGEEEGPFRSGSFTLSFGNGEVTMLIDGRQTEIPPTASPIGYSIDSRGVLSELSDAERPTCT